MVGVGGVFLDELPEAGLRIDAEILRLQEVLKDPQRSIVRFRVGGKSRHILRHRSATRFRHADDAKVDRTFCPARAYNRVMESRAGSSRPAHAGNPRQRILNASFELFAQRGIRDVGVDELITRSEVAKATFYNHFHSKDELALTYLERLYDARREEMDAAVRNRDGPHALLGIFDVFEELFSRSAPEGSSFVHVLMEMGPDHPLGQASIDFLARTRAQLEELAERAGLLDPEQFAHECHLLIKGAIVAAIEGDDHAAERARRLAAWLIKLHQEPEQQ